MRNSEESVEGSIVHFGEMYKRPANSRLYSAQDERCPTSANVVLGKAGESFKGIGEYSIASVDGTRSKVFTGNPILLHSSANTYVWSVTERTYLNIFKTFIKIAIKAIVE